MDGTQLDRVRIALVSAGHDIGPLSATQISGGRSNLTFRLTDGHRSLILRRPPAAGLTPSAHDVAREFTFMRALAPTGVPVPPTVLLVEDASVIGAPFAVTEFVQGDAVRSRTDLDKFADGALETLVDRLVETLATLHEVNHNEVGFPSRESSGTYAERQLRRWSGQWEQIGVDKSGRAEDLIQRLRRKLPAQRRTSIVHGDYRCDNTLVATGESPSISAVVDWELATVGDPTADVAMMCAYRHPAFDDVVGFDAAWSSDRLPSPNQLGARYSAAAGQELDDWEFNLALADFKIAVITAGISYRHGMNGDDGADRAGLAVTPFLDAGLELV